MPTNFKKQNAMNTMAGKGEKTELPLDEICFRAENKYINNQEEARSILESIKADGLIEPITVENIDDFLKSDDIDLLPVGHKLYYMKKKEEGFNYFISTGHRRFRAYACLALGIPEFPENIDEVYSQIREERELSEKALEEENYERINKYCSIKCFVAKDNVKQERQRYNSSNLEQRRLTDFEIVANVIDDLKMYGIWEEWELEYPEKYVGNLSDRAVTSNLKTKRPGINLPKTIQEQREMLKTIPVEELHGFQSYMNNKIIDYVDEKKSKKLSLSSVNYSRKIIEDLGPRSEEEKGMADLIFAGHIDYKNARAILSYSEKIDDEHWKLLLETIKEHKFNSRTAERDFAGGIDMTKNLSSENKLTRKEILKKLYKVKNGKMSIDELICELEK